jgi:hypothetical protein
MLRVRFCDKDKEILDLLAHNLVKMGKELGTTSKTAAPSNVDLAYQWSWKQDSGEYNPFDADQNYQIEMAYLKQNKKGKIIVRGDLHTVKNNFQYEVDFDKMTELNTTHRRAYREIKREEKALSKYIKWQIDFLGQWESFDPITSSQIELAYKSKSPSISVMFQTSKLLLSFASLRAACNYNALYHSVRRHDSYEEFILHSVNRTNDSGQVSVALNNEKRNISANFTGLKDDLPKGIQFYQRKLKDLTCEETVDMENNNITPAMSDDLDQIGLKFGVEVNKTNKKKVVLTGLVRPVSQALKAVMEMLRTASTTSYDKPPDSWTLTPQTDSNSTLVDVLAGSAEWKSIETRMKATMPTIKIHQIQRVQNMWQWQKYAFLRDRLARKSGNPEMLLFHGTRANTPSLIYNGDDGFDMRFSNQGMWGRASYFAVNASYSHNYAFTTRTKMMQMFSARVAIGKSIVLVANNTHVKPPDGYDTVSGTTGDSVVFMVYENGRAYPEHLITYQC